MQRGIQLLFEGNVIGRVSVSNIVKIKIDAAKVIFDQLRGNTVYKSCTRMFAFYNAFNIFSIKIAVGIAVINIV